MTIIKQLKIFCTECDHEDEITDADDPEIWDDWLELQDDECPGCIKCRAEQVLAAVDDTGPRNMETHWNCRKCGCSWKTKLAAELCSHGKYK